MSEQNEYNKKIKIIIKLINITYPNETFIFEKFNNNIFNEKIIEFIKVIINNKTSIIILPNNTWEEIERNINIKLNNTIENKKEYIICLNNTYNSVSCNKCCNYLCVLYHIELFKKDNGIITCPFCRFSFGIYTPDNMIYVLKK